MKGVVMIVATLSHLYYFLYHSKINFIVGSVRTVFYNVFYQSYSHTIKKTFRQTKLTVNPIPAWWIQGLRLALVYEINCYIKSGGNKSKLES